MKNGQRTSRPVSAVLFGMALVACASTAGFPGEADVTLVRLVPDPSRVSLTARMDGVLAVRNGCVYLLSARDGVPSLVLWPSTYRLWQSGRRIKGAFDTATGQSLAFGMPAVFAGGQATQVMASELEAPIPPACDGPVVYSEFSSV